MDRENLAHHLRSLEQDSLDEYLQWCKERRFSTRLPKSDRQLRIERKRAREEKDERVASGLKRRAKSPAAALDRIFAGDASPDELSPEHRVVHELLSSLGRKKETRPAFYDLLVRAHRGTKLISTTQVIPEYPADAHNTMIGALASLATHRRAWIRELDDWKPSSKNATRQLGSLVRHLLAEYDVPGFFDSVWFKRSRTQNWFLHVARCGNLRTAERVPIKMTKRTAHEVSQAPAEYTVEQALRWGQVHELGGNRRMVEAVIATRLGRGFSHEDFWLSVLRFFVANPLLDTVHYGPIVDYIQHQKYESQFTFPEPRVRVEVPPPHSGFSMRGRTADALLERVEAWHQQLGRQRRHLGLSWSSSPIPPLDFVEGSARRKNMKHWTIVELLNSAALTQEGRAMRHCVSSYAGSCAAGRSTIWSLSRDEGNGPERRLTIEVRVATKTITEARGRRNEPPTPKDMEILRRWASEASLNVAGYVER